MTAVPPEKMRRVPGVAPAILPAELAGDAPDFSAELDEALLVGGDPPEAATRWQITTRGQAEWAMRKAAALTARAVEIGNYAGDWRARVDDWEREELGRLEPAVSFFFGHLEAYGVTHREEHPDEATVRVPSGEIATTMPRTPKIDVADEDVLLDWLAAFLPTDIYLQLVKVTTSPKILNVRKAVTAAPVNLPFCQVCGAALDFTAIPIEHLGVAEVHRSLDVPESMTGFDHEPVPVEGYEVQWAGLTDEAGEAIEIPDLEPGTAVPGLVALLGDITAKVKPAR